MADAEQAIADLRNELNLVKDRLMRMELRVKEDVGELQVEEMIDKKMLNWDRIHEVIQKAVGGAGKGEQKCDFDRKNARDVMPGMFKDEPNHMNVREYMHAVEVWASALNPKLRDMLSAAASTKGLFDEDKFIDDYGDLAKDANKHLYQKLTKTI